MLRTGRGRLLLGAAVVVLLVVGFGGWWFFIRDDAPPEASVEAAREGQEQAGGGSSGDGSGGGSGSGDVEGTWTVQQTPDAEGETGTFAGYRIQEELASIGGNTAVGRTRGVTGTITIEGDQVTAGSFEVDMTTLQSDEAMRDNRLRGEGLETERFPTATFTLTEPLAIPDDAAPGEEVQLSAVGELDLHGVTRPATVDLRASFDGDTISVAGSAPVALADHQIEPPVGFSVLSIADEGTFEVQLLLARQ
jgi:polyisoprenoid-binding protein YceI